MFERFGTKIRPKQLNSRSQAADAGSGVFSSTGRLQRGTSMLGGANNEIKMLPATSF